MIDKNCSVWMCDADTSENMNLIGKGKSLVSALRIAMKEIETGNVEYGIFYISPKILKE
jgi:hypothetical protein